MKNKQKIKTSEKIKNMSHEKKVIEELIFSAQKLNKPSVHLNRILERMYSEISSLRTELKNLKLSNF